MSDIIATQPTAIDINGVLWYSQSSLCELLGKTDQTLRNWTKCNPPIVIKDESMGVKLYRLADGVTLYQPAHGEKTILGSPASQQE